MNTPFTELTAALLQGSASDIGKRPNQEDRFAVKEYTTADGRPALLAMVADGIGGHNSGEIASNMAQNMIPSLVLGNPPSASETTRRLKAALEETSNAIYLESLKEAGRAGMGTTCTAVAIIDRRLYLAHVGDSRAYLLRGGQLHQLTIDHTWAEEALRAGRPAEEIRTHPNRGVIMRYLGIDPNIAIDTHYKTLGNESVDGLQAGPFFLEPGDTLLLSSDGVSDTLDPRFLAEYMAYPNCQTAAEALVASAFKAGATDNMTAVVLRLPGGTVVAPKAAGAQGGKKRSLLPIIAGVLGLLVVAAVAALLLSRGGGGTPAAPQPSVEGVTVAAPSQGGAQVTPTKRSSTGGATGGGVKNDTAVPTVEGGTPEPTLAPVQSAAVISTTEVMSPTLSGEPTIAPTFTPDVAPPTATPRPVAGSPTRIPTQTPRGGGRSAPTSTDGVTLLAPPEHERLSGSWRFEWSDQPGFGLGSKESYELIIWGLSEDPMISGRSPVGANRQTNANVNLTDFESSWHLEDGKTYMWGVRLFSDNRPQRMLSDGRLFVYVRASTGNGGTVPTPCVGDCGK